MVKFNQIDMDYLWILISFLHLPVKIAFFSHVFIAFPQRLNLSRFVNAMRVCQADTKNLR